MRPTISMRSWTQWASAAALAVSAWSVAPAAHAQGAAESFQPEETVPFGLSAQITEDGFETLNGAVNTLVPALIQDLGVLAIDDVDAAGIISLKNIQPAIKSVDLEIIPEAPSFAGAVLKVYATIVLSVNSANEPYDISAIFCGGDGYIESLTAITPRNGPGIPLEIVVQDGNFKLDLSIPNNSLELRNPQAKGECGGLINGAATALQSVLINALVIPQVNQLLKGTPSAPGLLADIEDALKAANIDMTGEDAIDVLGKPLNVQLKPRQAFSSAGGLELAFDSHIFATQDPCVADIDPLGSLKTPPLRAPSIDLNGPDVEIAAMISDDLVNQALYAVFSGGLLCIDVDEELLGSSAGLIPKGPALIGLLAGNDLKPEFDKFLEEDAETLLSIAPTRVPTVHYDRNDPITIDASGLNLNVYTDVDFRTARLLALGIDAEVGLDLELVDGNLGVLLNGLDANSFEFYFTGDEYVAGTADQIAINAQGAFGGILGSVLPGLLGDSLSFALPSFNGLGLGSITLTQAGDGGDWVKGAITIATNLPPGDPDAGCGGCGGSGGGGGCGGGCSNGQLGGGAYLFFFFPLVALRRRKR